MNDWDPWNDWGWDNWSWDVPQNSNSGYENWGGKTDDELNAVKGKGKGYQTPFYGNAKNVSWSDTPN